MARLELKKCPYCGSEVDTVSVKEKDGNLCIEVKAKNIPAVNRWISVQERLPETPYEGFGVHFYYSDCVLVSGKDWLGMAYYVTERGESRWEFADARTKQIIDWTEITHWMPIPEIPEPPEKE